MDYYIFENISKLQQSKVDQFKPEEGYARLTAEFVFRMLVRNMKQLNLSDHQVRSILLMNQLLWLPSSISFEGYIELAVINSFSSGFNSYRIVIHDKQIELRNSGAEDQGAGHDSFGHSYYPTSLNTKDDFQAGEFMLDLARFHEGFTDMVLNEDGEISIIDELDF